VIVLLKKLLADPTHNVALQVPRALVASTISAVVDCSVYFAVILSFGVAPIPAAVLGYLVGGVSQYYLCSVWVFPAAPSNVLTGFLTFTLLAMVGLAITCLSMSVMIDWLHVHYAPAKIISLGVAFGWNFGSRKFLLFRANASQV